MTISRREAVALTIDLNLVNLLNMMGRARSLLIPKPVLNPPPSNPRVLLPSPFEYAGVEWPESGKIG
jgi:hypothetical protein